MQLVVHQVDEVRRLHRLRGGLGHGQRRLARQGVIAFADQPVLPHQAQHHVAPLPQAVGMVERVVQSGPLDHAGELGGLGQSDLAEILPQVGLGRFAEAMDAERAAPAEVDIVGVILENRVLG